MPSELDHLLYNDNDGAVLALAFDSQGKVLASGDAGGAVKLWDLAGETLLASLREHSRAVRALAFSPDGQHLVSGSRDGTVQVWDVATFTERFRLRPDNSP